MRHIVDGCGKGEGIIRRVKDIDCENCLEILHERATQKFILAYNYLCDVKRQRYEAAYEVVEKEKND